jgi:hypothetical protein
MPRWYVQGVRSVRKVGDAAEVPETEHGARAAHWVTGQWGQSEWMGRPTEGIEPWCPWRPPSAIACVGEAACVAQCGRCIAAGPVLGTLRTPRNSITRRVIWHIRTAKAVDVLHIMQAAYPARPGHATRISGGQRMGTPDDLESIFSAGGCEHSAGARARLHAPRD